MNGELSPRAKVLVYGLMSVLLIPFVFPTWWMVTSSIKPISDIFAFPPEIIPSRVDLSTYARVFELQPFAQ
jgi:multiple sugar transport system permease protein